MVLGRAYQPPQRRPVDLARHHLETIWQEKTSRETSQAVERRPGQILKRHDMAEDSTRQSHLETTCWGLRPTTGHNGCLMMMMMMNYIMKMVFKPITHRVKFDSHVTVRWCYRRRGGCACLCHGWGWGIWIVSGLLLGRLSGTTCYRGLQS